MEILLFSFVAAALSGWGDRAQLLAAALSARDERPLPILAGLALAALGMAGFAAFAGAAVHPVTVPRQQSLLLVVALVFAGVTGPLRAELPPRALRFRGGTFLTALVFGFVFASGSRTQILTIAFAARADAPILAAAGGAAGLIAALAPAALLGDQFPAKRLAWLRWVAAGLFLLAAFVLWTTVPPRA